MESKMERINALLKKPCFIMDYLPEQVKPDNGGQFFDVEYYLLNSDKHISLKDRFVSVILKLMCYYHVAILWNGWVDRLSDGKLKETIKAYYFSTLPRIDRAVFYEKAHSNRRYGTFPSKPVGIDKRRNM